MKKTVLICGAGGFIGGSLVANLIRENNYNIICADIKPFEYWFQFFDHLENFSLDLKEY
jgi:nucleoside-diphosphate-sugar epimerase